MERTRKSTGTIPKTKAEDNSRRRNSELVNTTRQTTIKKLKNNSNNNIDDADKNIPHFVQLLQIFSDICPIFLREKCEKTCNCKHCFEMLLNCLLNEGYKKRELVKLPELPSKQLDFNEQYNMLVNLFPKADSNFLHTNCEKLINNPEDFSKFVTKLLDSPNYPTNEKYIKNLKTSTQIRELTTDFDLKNFLDVIPNPIEYFNRNLNDEQQKCARIFLKYHYKNISLKDIDKVFRESNHNLTKTCDLLDQHKTHLKYTRYMSKTEFETECLLCSSIPLLQEIAYITHKKEILQYLKDKEEEKTKKKIAAKAAGFTKTCECCFDDEVIEEEVVRCGKNHEFCKSCVKTGCEVKIGEGKLDFPCLIDCGELFSLQILQSVLTPQVFSKLAQKKQIEEVKSAGIEDLEFCPFCDFATILPPEHKIFQCLNPVCMKESCKKCKRESHIPLSCEEIEEESETKVRTYLENQMTEALVRKCYKCGLNFIKESGCNKMTCSCGAKMCYVCKKPVEDYSHFNGPGGDKLHLCPLFSDMYTMHMQEIQQTVTKVRTSLGLKDKKLKYDPTKGLEDYYNELKIKYPQNLCNCVNCRRARVRQNRN